MLMEQVISGHYTARWVWGERRKGWTSEGDEVHSGHVTRTDRVIPSDEKLKNTMHEEKDYFLTSKIATLDTTGIRT
jgi:hypothetical protein